MKQTRHHRGDDDMSRGHGEPGVVPGVTVPWRHGSVNARCVRRLTVRGTVASASECVHQVQNTLRGERAHDDGRQRVAAAGHRPDCDELGDGKCDHQRPGHGAFSHRMMPERRQYAADQSESAGPNAGLRVVHRSRTDASLICRGVCVRHSGSPSSRPGTSVERTERLGEPMGCAGGDIYVRDRFVRVQVLGAYGGGDVAAHHREAQAEAGGNDPPGFRRRKPFVIGAGALLRDMVFTLSYTAGEGRMFKRGEARVRADAVRAWRRRPRRGWPVRWLIGEAAMPALPRRVLARPHRLAGGRAGGGFCAPPTRGVGPSAPLRTHGA